MGPEGTSRLLEDVARAWALTCAYDLMEVLYNQLKEEGKA